MELNYEALGKRINRLRKEKSITQSLLAERVGIEPSNIPHIKRAASKAGLGTLVKIANVLECSVDDLLCDSILCEREASFQPGPALESVRRQCQGCDGSRRLG